MWSALCVRVICVLMVCVCARAHVVYPLTEPVHSLENSTPWGADGTAAVEGADRAYNVHLFPICLVPWEHA